ncbi:MAG: hypothetical protein AAF270_16975 [Pseudomonadota bacterium]
MPADVVDTMPSPSRQPDTADAVELSERDIARRIAKYRHFDPGGWNDWINRKFEQGLVDVDRVQANSSSLGSALESAPEWQEADNRFECSADLCKLDFARPIHATRLRAALQGETTNLPDIFFQKQFFGFERPGGRTLRVYVLRKDIDYSDVPVTQ